MRQLTDDAAEHAAPAWVQGMRTFCWSHEGAHGIYYLRNSGGARRVLVQPATGGLAQPLGANEGYTWFEHPCASPAADALAGAASSSFTPARVVVADGAGTRVLRRSAGELVPTEKLAAAHPVSWPTAGGAVAHGLLYLPAGYTPGQAGPRPPAMVHPRRPHKPGALSPQAQFFATRGYAVLAVNYRGSTGYGRAYMLALRQRWGVCDVEDSVSAARRAWPTRAGRPDRLVITGGSAGGFTVLQTMIEQPDAFRAGICLYGVANQFHLAADTHKFEARYLDRSRPAARSRRPSTASAPRSSTPTGSATPSRSSRAPTTPSSRRRRPIVAALRHRGVPQSRLPQQGARLASPGGQIEAFYTAVDAFLRQHVIFA